MRVRELVEPPGPSLPLLAGAAGLDRDFETVTVTDLPDPTRYLRGGELVLSGLMWLADQRGSSAARCETFVGAVARGGCSGLAVGDTTDDPLPVELVAACARRGATCATPRVTPPRSRPAMTSSTRCCAGRWPTSAC